MPARVSHLPTYRERVALQLLRGRSELPLKALHPTGMSTVAKMVSKGWVECVSAGTYRITPAGDAAMKAELPNTGRK